MAVEYYSETSGSKTPIAMASIPSGTGTANQHAQSSNQPLASTSAEQPARNHARQPGSSSAGQPAMEYPDVVISSPGCHTPDYPATTISILPSIGQLHHHYEPVIAYNEHYFHCPAPKVCYPSDYPVTTIIILPSIGLLHHHYGPERARSAEQPANYSRVALATDVPWSQRFPPCRFKAPPPLPPWRLERPAALRKIPLPETIRSLHPPPLQNAIRAYDRSPYWKPPTVTARMALTNDFVCTLGPEFSMLGVRHFGRVIDAERYVSAVLQQEVRVVYIGNTRAPDIGRRIAELLLLEQTDKIFVQPVPM